MSEYWQKKLEICQSFGRQWHIFNLFCLKIHLAHTLSHYLAAELKTLK